MLTGCRQVIEPSIVGFRMLHLGTVQQLQQKRFVAGSALDDDNTLAQRPLQPRKSFFAVLAVGDDLGDHRVEVWEMASPSATPVSTRTPGPVSILNRSIAPGAGAKPFSGSSALSRTSMA